MSIWREQAFSMFEELLTMGHRPILTGMKVTEENRYKFHDGHWPVGTEGFFLSVALQPMERAGLTWPKMRYYHELAQRHGLTAYFTTTVDDYDDGPTYGAAVTFEQSVQVPPAP